MSQTVYLVTKLSPGPFFRPAIEPEAVACLTTQDEKLKKLQKHHILKTYFLFFV